MKRPWNLAMEELFTSGALTLLRRAGLKRNSEAERLDYADGAHERLARVVDALNTKLAADAEGRFAEPQADVWLTGQNIAAWSMVTDYLLNHGPLEVRFAIVNLLAEVSIMGEAVTADLKAELTA